MSPDEGMNTGEQRSPPFVEMVLVSRYPEKWRVLDTETGETWKWRQDGRTWTRDASAGTTPSALRASAPEVIDAISDMRAASQEIGAASRLMTDDGISPGIARSLAIHSRRLSAAADALEHAAKAERAPR